MTREPTEARVEEAEFRLRVRAREFIIPPVKDALLIGRRSPVGHVAMQRSLALLSPDAFEALPVADHPSVGTVLVRRAILLKVPRERVVAFLLDRLGPMMADTEILHVDLDVEIELEGTL